MFALSLFRILIKKFRKLTMKAQSDRRGMEHRTMQDMIAPETLNDG